jgi:hypothetical protein
MEREKDRVLRVTLESEFDVGINGFLKPHLGIGR